MAETWANKDVLFKQTVPKERHTIQGVGDVWIHGLTCGQKDEYENQAVKVLAGSREVRMADARALLLLWTVHDQHGNRFFSEKDMGKIRTIPAAISEPMYEKARRLSRMSIEDMEGLVKNSVTIQGGDSAIE